MQAIPKPFEEVGEEVAAVLELQFFYVSDHWLGEDADEEGEELGEWDPEG